MPDYSARNIKRNSTLLLIYKVASIILSFLYVPIVLRYLGVELYGVWAVILNVVSWIAYFDIGIGNGLRNQLSIALAREENESSIKSLVSSAYILLSAIVTVMAIVAILLFQLINWNSLLNVDSHLYSDLKAPICVSFLLMCLSFIFSICKSLFFAIQKAHIVNLLGVVQQALMLASVCALFLFPTLDDPLFSVAVVYGLSSVVVGIGFTGVFFYKHEKYMPSLKYFSKAKAIEVTDLGLRFFVVQIASLLLFSTSTIIVSNIFGPSEVTPFSTANKLFMALASLYVAVITPFWSSITANYERQGSRAIPVAILSMAKPFLVTLSGCFLLYLFYDTVIAVWLGQPLENPDGLILGMFIYTGIYMFNAIFSQVTNGLSCLKMMMIVAIVQAILNIPVSYMLALSIGTSTGVLLGNILVMLISTAVYPAYLYFKFLRKPNDGTKTSRPKEPRL